MAVTELYTSREMHITKEGTALTQIFTCSDTDLNNWGDGTTALPIIGQAWSTVREDLRVTDIRTWWLNNKNCRVEALYSTVGLAYRSHLPDKTSSITSEFDFSLVTEDATRYWNYHPTTSDERVVKIWADVWEAASANNTVDNVPPLQVLKPSIVHTLTFNIEQWKFSEIRRLIGTVNDADFIKEIIYKRIDGKPGTKPHWEPDDATGVDTGQWLFAGFNSRQVGDGNCEIVATFIYSFGFILDETQTDEKNKYPNMWNKPYGVTAYLYRRANFKNLPLPDDTDDDIDDGLR